MRCGWLAIFFSLCAFAAENPSQLKVQYQLKLQRAHKLEQINSNTILVPGEDWATMISDRSLIVQGKIKSLTAESGSFEFQVLDAETKNVLSAPRIAGAYGEESTVRNTLKGQDGREIFDMEMKIKPIVVEE